MPGGSPPRKPSGSSHGSQVFTASAMERTYSPARTIPRGPVAGIGPLDQVVFKVTRTLVRIPCRRPDPVVVWMGAFDIGSCLDSGSRSGGRTTARVLPADPGRSAGPAGEA